MMNKFVQLCHYIRCLSYQILSPAPQCLHNVTWFYPFWWRFKVSVGGTFSSEGVLHSNQYLKRSNVKGKWGTYNLFQAKLRKQFYKPKT